MLQLAKLLQGLWKTTIKSGLNAKYKAITLWLLIFAFTFIMYLVLSSGYSKFFLIIFFSW